MKKIISIIAVLTLAVAAGLAQTTSASDLFAFETTNTDNDTKKTVEVKTDFVQESAPLDWPEELVDALKKPWDNGDTISSLTAGYSLGKKNALYNEFEKSKGKAIGLNWVGFGIGSFTQGDGLGGGLGVAFDILSYGSLSIGTGFFVVGLIASIPVAIGEGLGGGSGEGVEAVEGLLNTGIGLFAVGSLIWLGNRIFGTIRPITFQKKYNSSLKSALGLDDVVDDISLIPIVNPVESQYGLLARVTF